MKFWAKGVCRNDFITFVYYSLAKRILRLFKANIISNCCLHSLSISLRIPDNKIVFVHFPVIFQVCKHDFYLICKQTKLRIVKFNIVSIFCTKLTRIRHLVPKIWRMIQNIATGSISGQHFDLKKVFSFVKIWDLEVSHVYEDLSLRLEVFNSSSYWNLDKFRTDIRLHPQNSKDFVVWDLLQSEGWKFVRLGYIQWEYQKSFQSFLKKSRRQEILKWKLCD